MGPSPTSRRITPDEQAEAEAEHQAEIKKNREWWRANYGPEGIFGAKTFENFDDRNPQPKAFKALHDWRGKSVVLYSEVYGVGKTHLVSALANKLIDTCQDTECPVFVTTEIKTLDRIRATFNRHDEDSLVVVTEELVYRSLEHPRLLIIDDVGKRTPRDYSFLQEVFFRLIDYRYIHGKPIILTANLSLEELEKHIGGASADRLREMAGKDGFIKLTGKSQRH